MLRSGNFAKASTLLMGLGGCYTCFLAGTPISTPSGRVPIEDIRIGQSVYSYDEANQRIVVGTVSRIFVHEDTPYGRLLLSDGRQLAVTGEHPIYLPEQQQYVEAQALDASHSLLLLNETGKTPALHRETIARGLQGPERRGTVHNFTVEHFENYFANGILVHNKSVQCDDSCLNSFTVEIRAERGGSGGGSLQLGKVGQYDPAFGQPTVCTTEICEDRLILSKDVVPHLYSIAATPDATSRLLGWNGICGGVNSCTFELFEQMPTYQAFASFSRCDPGQWCPRYPVSPVASDALRSVLSLSAETTLVAAIMPGEYDPLTHSQTFLWRFDGAHLLPVAANIKEPIYGMSASSPTQLWAVGKAGTLLSGSGEQWSPLDSRTTNDLYGTWSDATDTWVVGAAGTILRGRIEFKSPTVSV